MSNSPDVTPFVDLRIYDLDVQEIFDNARMHIESRMPDVTLREDHTETILIEAMALMIAENTIAINRLPSSILTALLKMYGSPFYEGKAPVFTVKFKSVDNFHHEVPANTRVALQINDSEYIMLSTETAGNIALGQSEVTVTATTTDKTSAGNKIAIGTSLDLLDQLPFVEEVTLASLVTPGEDPETDVVWLNRSVQKLNRLTDTLVVADHFQSAALEETGVYRAYAIDNYNGTTNTPSVPGHITVAVYGAEGALSSTRRQEILSVLQERSIVNLTVHVVDPTITNVNVTATVIGQTGFSDDDIRANVTAALKERFTPYTWDWRKELNKNELITAIGSAPGVAYLKNITVPSTEVTSLPGAAPLVNINVINITVE